MLMPKLNGKGLIAGIVVWVGIMIYTINQTACLKTNTCDGDDLFLTAVLAIGMLAPAWIVAIVVSGMFEK
jgi:hypothetical protein